MRILIAAAHSPEGGLAIGGVQSWSVTVGLELERLGHDVEYWGLDHDSPRGTFDAGIFANLGHTGHLLSLCGRALRVAHGIIEDERGGPGFAATSEEVKHFWGCDGPIIRQPIDLDFWHVAREPREYLTRFSYRGGLECLPVIAGHMGLEYRHVSTLSAPAARDVLQRSAVVVASGRAAVEAMACGVPVVLADDRAYQGPLLDVHPEGAMTRNYSGRGGVVPTYGLVQAAIEQAIAYGSLRAHAEAHHDVCKITREILCLLS